MAEDPPQLSPSERAGERAALNTVTRAVGEIVGKLASLVLFAALARKVGESDLGVYVFAFAWAASLAAWIQNPGWSGASGRNIMCSKR